MTWPKAPLKLSALLLPVLLLTAAAPVVSEAASTAQPAVVEVRTIGRSVQGRAITAWRLGEPSSSRKVVVLAAMHGDEPGPSRILANLRDGRPIRGADIWVVPTYNV